MNKFFSIAVGCGAFVAALVIVIIVTSDSKTGKSDKPSGAPVLIARPVRQPIRKVETKDFQTALDKTLLSKLNDWGGNPISVFLNDNVVKPFFDDQVTINYIFNAVEVTENQFPQRPEIWQTVVDCARVLNLEKIPRVFILNDPVLNAYTCNMIDPIIVITSGLLREIKDVGELRFIIGHEMGHIKCKHVKWMIVIRTIHIIKPDLVRQEMDALQKSMPEGKPKELSRKVLEAGEKQFMQWFKDHFIPEYSGRSDCREILCVYLKRWWCGQTLFNKHISQAEARDLIFRENSENAAWEITYHRLDYAFRQAGIEGDAL